MKKTLCLFSCFLIMLTTLLVGSCGKKKDDPIPPSNNYTSDCYYDFTKSTNAYSDITSPDGSLSNIDYTSLALPFPVTLFGKTFNSLKQISYDEMQFDDTIRMTIKIQDWCGKTTCTWKTEGTIGNRIFKIQFANSCVANQYWLYENGNLEYRFGRIVSANPGDLSDDPVGVYYMYDNTYYDPQSEIVCKGTILKGEESNPEVNCFDVQSTSTVNAIFDAHLTEITYQTTIPAGMTYTFSKLK